MRRSAAHHAALADAWRALWTSRLVAWTGGVAAVLAFGVSAQRELFDPAGITAPFGAVGDLLVAPAARWDSVWFLAIARDGYGDGVSEAFFPLYPALTGAAGAVTGSHLVGGLLISAATFAVGLYLLHRLVALDFGRAVAGTTVLLLALSPMAFFFTAVYSEALFLALSVATLLAARTGRWAWAGALGALAAATRSAGVVLLVPLVVMYLWGPREDGGPRRAGGRFPLRADALWLALVPGGLVAFCAFLWLAGHDPLAPFDAQAAWFREFAGPFVGAWEGAVAAWQGARQLWSGAREPVLFTAAGGDPFDVARKNLELFAWLVAGAVALAGAVRRLPVAYWGYALVALALPLSYPVGPQPLMSLPRFLLVLFPLWLWLALWVEGGTARRRVVAVTLCAVGLAVYTGLFATWHWVA